MKNQSASRKSLLASSRLAATATMLSLHATPALADCTTANNTTCQWWSTGTAGPGGPSSGAPANGNGHDGTGGGGGGDDWVLVANNYQWVDAWFVSPQLAISPVDVRSVGGPGGEGSSATAGWSDRNGGSGGLGGEGGFDLETAGPGTLGRFSIGTDLLGAKNVALSVQYAPEFGKDFTVHAGTARLTVAF